MSKCLSNAVWESESYNASPSAIIALCAENVGHTQPHICMQSPFFIQITCDRVSRAYLVVRLSSVSQPNSQFQFVFCNEMMVKFEFKMQLCATCLIWVVDLTSSSTLTVHRNINLQISHTCTLHMLIVDVDSYGDCKYSSIFIGFPGYAHKECESNGEWFKHPLTNKSWSNYTTCINLQDFEVCIIMLAYITRWSVEPMGVMAFLHILHCCMSADEQMGARMQIV